MSFSMKQASLLLATLMTGALSLTAQAADVEAGKKLATSVCVACHGATGKSTIPIYPHLAGQNEAYLVNSLKAYKNKERNGGQAVIMQAQAAALSEADMANVAAYYASQKP